MAALWRREGARRWVCLAVALLAIGLSSPAVSGVTPAGARDQPTDASLPVSVSPVVAVMRDAATGGYWIVAANGAVFSFNAPFLGSAGSLRLTAPVVGGVATPDGGGYYLVAADGGIFAFGDAVFLGSMGGRPLPVVGMAVDPATGGYWLVAADGGVFSFGAPFFGSTGALILNRAVVGIIPSATGSGYLFVGGDGGIFAFGDAAYMGSVRVLPLAGLIVAIDPGHDGGNAAAPGVINQPIDGGGIVESCDTAGTETPEGYSEHAFNFDVASRMVGLLQAEGATVVLTRPDDNGVGPCVDVRAAIANWFHADAAISIHADGGPPDGRGFTVTMPAPVVSSISDNRAVVPASEALGSAVRDAFAVDTGEPPSTYDGVDGLISRSDLGGLNLTTVPKVLVECANMQNGTDAALTEDPAWRQSAAQGLVDGVTAYLLATLRT